MPLKKSDRFNFLLIGVVVFLAYISFQIVRPYINTILTALLVAFMFYPAYSWLEKRTKATIASFLMSAIILLLIVLPTYFAVNTLSTEARYVYLRTKQVSATGSFFTVQCTTKDFYCLASKGIDQLVDDPQLNLYFRNYIGKITDYFINAATNFILYLPEFFLHIFIVFFVLYYAFKESDHFIQTFKKIFPGGAGVSEVLVTQLKSVVNAVVWGSLIVAFLQGVSALIGFWIFDIPSPFLWSLLVGLVALVPMIGAISVWFPLGVFYILSGVVGNDNWALIQGIFLFVYGFFIISGIEHVLKPKIISKWGNVHPVLVIIGALGGITVFGAIGFIIGPRRLALAKTVLEEPRVRMMFGI